MAAKMTLEQSTSQYGVGTVAFDQGHAPDAVLSAPNHPPTPIRVFRRAVGEIYSLLRRALVGNEEVELTRVSVRMDLGREHQIRPDILVSRKVNNRHAPSPAIDDIPLIAIEIQAPNSICDQVTRFRAYQRSGIAEYWRVDLIRRIVERWTPGEKHPELCESLLVWEPPNQPPSRIDLPRLFNRILGR